MERERARETPCIYFSFSGSHLPPTLPRGLTGGAQPTGLAAAGGEKRDTTAVLICGRDRRPSHGGEPGVRATGQRKAENTAALNNPPVTWGP